MIAPRSPMLAMAAGWIVLVPLHPVRAQANPQQAPVGVRLKVANSTPERELALDQLVAQVLAFADVRLASAGQRADAELYVDVQGKRLSATYSVVPGAPPGAPTQTLATGAQVVGEVRLDWSDVHLRIPFNGRVDPPREVSLLGHRPFEVALRQDSSLQAALVQVVGRINGGKPLARMLTSPDAHLQHHAARAAGIIRDTALVEPIIARLTALGRAGVDALGAIADRRAVPALANLARAGDKFAVIALGKIGDPVAAPAIIAAVRERRLLDTEWSYAAEALGTMGQAAAALLLTLMNDTSLAVFVIEALGRTGAHEAVGPLSRVFRGPATANHLWTHTAIALASIGGPGVDTLLAILGEPDNERRANAAAGLGKAPEPRTAAALIRLIADSTRAGMEARTSLREHGAIAIPLLVSTLASDDPLARGYAILTLAAIDSIALPALVGHLRDPNPRIADGAARASGRILHFHPVEIGVLKCELEGPARRQAIIALGYTRDHGATELLMAALDDSVLRLEAIRALTENFRRYDEGRLPWTDPDARRLLYRISNDGTDFVLGRESSRWRHGPDVSRALKTRLLRLLVGADTATGGALIKALASITLPGYSVYDTVDVRLLAPLAAAMDSRDETLRETAWRALGNVTARVFRNAKDAQQWYRDEVKKSQLR